MDFAEIKAEIEALGKLWVFDNAKSERMLQCLSVLADAEASTERRVAAKKTMLYMTARAIDTQRNRSLCVHWFRVHRLETFRAEIQTIPEEVTK